MISLRMKSVAWLLVGAIAGGTVACGRSAAKPAKSPSASAPVVAAAASSGAAQVNAMLRAEWAKRAIVAAGPVDDARFLRRVYLDIVGRIPSSDELATFLADPASDRRAKTIDGLLASPAYADRWMRYWDEVLLGPKIDKKFVDREKFDAWLRAEFRANVPWNKLVYELVTANGYNREPPDPTSSTGPAAQGMFSA